MTEMTLTLESNRATDDRHGNVMELFSLEKRPGLEVTLSRTERRSLFERYRSAVRAFTQAVGCLDDDWSMEFRTSWERAEAARQRVDSCAELLLLHAQEPNGGERTDQRTEDLVLGDQGQSGG
jgi:hypothetical protein